MSKIAKYIINIAKQFIKTSIYKYLMLLNKFYDSVEEQKILPGKQHII
jgi:hypothetical protein